MEQRDFDGPSDAMQFLKRLGAEVPTIAQKDQELVDVFRARFTLEHLECGAYVDQRKRLKQRLEFSKVHSAIAFLYRKIMRLPMCACRDLKSMANGRGVMANLDDPRRLDPLGLHLTDVSHDDILDALVRKVAKKADTPIALVSLIMGRIQLFRASVGLPTELEESRATSRCTSFCQLVVKAEHEILIADATTDTCVPKELVDAYGIKAYIGVPIHHDGAVIGSLCAIDTKPRRWNSSLARALKAIATELAIRLDTLRENRDEEEAVALSDMALDLMLRSLLRDAKALEEPLSQLNELLRSEAWRDSTTAKSASEFVQVYRSMEESVLAMRRSALRLADAFELRKGRFDEKTLTALRQDARTVSRAFGEIGPLVRLVEGLTTGVISESSFAKNADVLREAEASAGDALESLRRIEAMGSRG